MRAEALLVAASTGSGLPLGRGFTAGVTSKRRTSLAPGAAGSDTCASAATRTRIGSRLRKSFCGAERETVAFVPADSSAAKLKVSPMKHASKPIRARMINPPEQVQVVWSSAIVPPANQAVIDQ